MYVLDTNILSAIMSARPSPELATWIAGQPEDALFTTTICQAEILAGLAVMPEGRRRVALETAARAILALS
jgi:toxin FitB